MGPAVSEGPEHHCRLYLYSRNANTIEYYGGGRERIQKRVRTGIDMEAHSVCSGGSKKTAVGEKIGRME